MHHEIAPVYCLVPSFIAKQVQCTKFNFPLGIHISRKCIQHNIGFLHVSERTPYLISIRNEFKCTMQTYIACDTCQ